MEIFTLLNDPVEGKVEMVIAGDSITLETEHECTHIETGEKFTETNRIDLQGELLQKVFGLFQTYKYQKAA